MSIGAARNVEATSTDVAADVAPATYQQIGKLREEAFTHGDEVMGQICNLAMDIGVVYDSLSERDSDRLRGMTQEQAIAECDRVIRDAAAQS